jgi:hypothetical protein
MKADRKYPNIQIAPTFNSKNIIKICRLLLLNIYDLVEIYIGYFRICLTPTVLYAKQCCGPFIRSKTQMNNACLHTYEVDNQIQEMNKH